MPSDVNRNWQEIFGSSFGYSPQYMETRYQQGAQNIGREFEAGRRAGLSDLNQRGFGTARPVGRMMMQSQGQQSRALGDYRAGLEQESEQLA